MDETPNSYAIAIFPISKVLNSIMKSIFQIVFFAVATYTDSWLQPRFWHKYIPATNPLGMRQVHV